jgi:hypothetical protein
MGAFQRTFFPADHWEGGEASGKVPVPSLRQPMGPPAMAAWVAARPSRASRPAGIVLLMLAPFAQARGGVVAARVPHALDLLKPRGGAEVSEKEWRVRVRRRARR